MHSTRDATRLDAIHSPCRIRVGLGLQTVPSHLERSHDRVYPWPYLHNLVQRMPPAVARATSYPALFSFNWLSASGTSCMLATLLSALVLKMPPNVRETLLSTCRQLAFPILTIAAVLSMAFVMNYSGITGTLGLAFAATGVAFPFFSAFLGWLGVFLTGSDTSSNALFGNLQVVTAGRLHVSPVLIAAANSAGGVMGKMISLQSIAVAAAATGMSVAKQANLPFDSPCDIASFSPASSGWRCCSTRM